MRKKEEKVVITFHTTTAAIKFESVAKNWSIPGRLIPVPQVISAGCGLSYAVSIVEANNVKRMVEEEKLEIEMLGIYTI